MKRPLRIGLVFETFGSYSRQPGDPVDFEAEYEPPETIDALCEAIGLLGHVPERIGTPQQLLRRLASQEPGLDSALWIAEGRGSRNREAWGPVLLDMAGVPLLGSDALTLSLSLDKLWTLRHVAAAGVAVAPHASIASRAQARTAALPADFPLFVKPRWEGTAKGIRATSRVESRAELVAEVDRIVRDYAQPALVEAFLPGAEYTVTVVGNDPPRALAVLQRGLDPDSRIGVHALAGAGRDSPPLGRRAITPGSLDPGLEDRLQRIGMCVYKTLECRDFARVDLKLDANDEAMFLEVNPLPTFAPDGSFGILAELAGRPLPALLADVLAAGLRRLGLPESAAQARASSGAG